MYRLLAMLYLSNFAISAVLPGDKDARVLSYNFQNFENGSYAFSYTASNGVARGETGDLINSGQRQYIYVRGYYSYTEPNRKYKFVQYTADDTGYHVNLDITLDPINQNDETEKSNDLFLDNRMLPPSAQLLGSLLGR